MRLLILILILVCGGMTGCPTEPATGITVEVRNASSFDARVRFAADDDVITIAAESARDAVRTLADCPDGMVLREVVLVEEELEVATVLVDGELAIDANYACGDTIVIEITDGLARLYTLGDP